MVCKTVKSRDGSSGVHWYVVWWVIWAKKTNHDGYLRAHHLPTDRDQADITADGKPYWTENWTKKKGSGGGGLGQPNLSDHSSEPHSERLTTFYLGLFY